MGMFHLKILEQLLNSQVLKKGSVPWSSSVTEKVELEVKYCLMCVCVCVCVCVLTGLELINYRVSPLSCPRSWQTYPIENLHWPRHFTNSCRPLELDNRENL